MFGLGGFLGLGFLGGFLEATGKSRILFFGFFWVVKCVVKLKKAPLREAFPKTGFEKVGMTAAKSPKQYQRNFFEMERRLLRT